jgi:hypothetical protein
MVTGIRMHWAFRADVHASDRRLAVELAAAVDELSSPIYFVAGDSIMALTWVDEAPPAAGGARLRRYRLAPAQRPRPNTCGATFLELWPSGCAVSQTIYGVEQAPSGVAPPGAREGAQAALEHLLRMVGSGLWPASGEEHLLRSA